MIRESAVRIPFRYAAGAAGSRFLVALRDERRILGSRCVTCACVLAPMRAFCPICSGTDLEELEVGPAGVVQSWTTRQDGTLFALVRLDGADTALLHRLLAVPGRAHCGMRVRALFAAERRGSILDLEGFVPAEGGAA